MSNGYRSFTRKNYVGKPKIEVTQFKNWAEWKEHERWNAYHGVALVYISHKRADDGRVFVKYEVVA